jgi:hypothetical protein
MSPRATPTEEPDGGNLLVRIWRGAGVGNLPAYSTTAFSTDCVRPPHATLPADARAWGRPARPAPAAGQRWMPPAGRRLAPQRTDRTGGWGRAAGTAGAARGEAARGD